MPNAWPGWIQIGLVGLVLGAAPAARAACGAAISRDDPRYPALRQALDTYRTQYQQGDGFSGVSLHVSLAANGPVLDVASGGTSKENGRPICPDTLFQIGSITKSFTAVLILRLEAAGKLSIHDTLGKFLPQYPAWSSIRIEQLLNMTAPLTDDAVLSAAFQKDFVADMHRTFTLARLVGYAYPGTPGPTPPWRYINTNYTLAAMIIEKVAGMSFADALRTYLFGPLRLTDMYYQPQVPPPSVLDAMASGYSEQSLCEEADHVPPPCKRFPLDDLLGHDMKTANRSGDDGSGGIVGSLPGVARWVRALLGGRLLPPRQQAELLSLVSQKSGKPIPVTSAADPRGYALGIGQDWLPLTDTPLWSYEGETFGYEVLWGQRVGDDAVVVIAQNSATANNHIAALYETVLRILEPGRIVRPAPAGGK